MAELLDVEPGMLGVRRLLGLIFADRWSFLVKELGMKLAK